MKWETMRLLRNLPNSDQKLLNRFAELFGFDSCAWYERPYSLVKLLNGSSSYNAGNTFDTSAYCGEWLDHGEAYRIKGTKRVVVVGHDYGPYEHIYDAVKRNVEPLNLRAVVFKRELSWYYPGQTSLVMIMTDETLDYYQSVLGEIDSDVVYTI